MSDAKTTGPKCVGVGDKVTHLFEGSADLVGSLVKVILATIKDDAAKTTTTSTVEDLMVHKAEGGKLGVDLVVDPLEAPPAVVRCKVVGQTDTSEDLHVCPPIQATDKPALTRIMLPEFGRKATPAELAKAPEKAWVFDDTTPKAFVKGLTSAQRAVLFNCPRPAGKPRLVVFVTLTAEAKRHRMAADWCGAHPGLVRSNASWSVFRCAGPKEPVVLLCHTERFLVNYVNYATLMFVNGLLGRKLYEPVPAGFEALARDNKRPPVFRLATGTPGPENYDVPFIRLFDPKGKDVMPGNTMHGALNTVGCWMLFRNYNWPDAHFADIDEKVHKRDRAYEFNVPKTKDGVLDEGKFKLALDAVVPGYTRNKYLWDGNDAYHGFFRDVVGLKYWGFSSGVTEDGTGTYGHEVVLSSKNVSTPYDPENEDGEVEVEETTLVGKTEVKKKVMRPVNAYPTSGKRPYPDSLWDFNAYHDKNASAFVTAGTAKNLEAASWADLYLWAEEGATFPPPQPPPPPPKKK